MQLWFLNPVNPEDGEESPEGEGEDAELMLMPFWMSALSPKNFKTELPTGTIKGKVGQTFDIESEVTVPKVLEPISEGGQKLYLLEETEYPLKGKFEQEGSQSYPILYTDKTPEEQAEGN